MDQYFHSVDIEQNESDENQFEFEMLYPLHLQFKGLWD